MAAKMKGLDKPLTSKSSSATSSRPQKDVNTFVNNQLKFSPAPISIPPDQMKCNILKAVTEERSKQSMIRFSDHLLFCIITGPPVGLAPRVGPGYPLSTFALPLSIHFLIFCSLLLPFPFFLFSSTLLIFFYCPSDPFLPE